jgi:hypothetical protein
MPQYMISIAAWDNCGTVRKNLQEKTLRLRNEQRATSDSHHMPFVILKCPMNAPYSHFKRKNTYENSLNLAEGVGFEPTVRLHAQRFSRPPRSTAPAPFLRGSKDSQGLAVDNLKNLIGFVTFSWCGNIA